MSEKRQQPFERLGGRRLFLWGSLVEMFVCLLPVRLIQTCHSHHERHQHLQ